MCLFLTGFFVAGYVLVGIVKLSCFLWKLSIVCRSGSSRFSSFSLNNTKISLVMRLSVLYYWRLGCVLLCLVADVISMFDKVSTR